ncbi:hypothetical protein TrVGV298_004705 [Trichoderma virens]|nr:hypothetical protein TrVGV298_004705 [Trichoderma virens]
MNGINTTAESGLRGGSASAVNSMTSLQLQIFGILMYFVYTSDTRTPSRLGIQGPWGLATVLLSTPYRLLLYAASSTHLPHSFRRLPGTSGCLCILEGVVSTPPSG